LSGGAAEIIEDGSSGFLFDPKNFFQGLEKLELLLDPQLRGQMGRNARQVFEERFRVERMAEEYWRTLARLVAAKTEGFSE